MHCRAKRITVCLAAILFLVPAGAMAATPGPVEPASVVVVANRSVPGSVKIARRYASMRNIPKANLIYIRSSERERVSREEYTRTIHNPILGQLLEKGLINGIKGDKDAFGRTTVMVVANPVRYMVLCYGVPTTVVSEPPPGLDDKALRSNGFRGKMTALGQSFDSGPLAKDMASVDGELALLLQRDVPLNGFIPNPFFRNPTPEKVKEYIKVMRLDGPTPKSVYRLLENTLAGERNGLRGRAYVDLDGRSGSYQMGNDWMTRVAAVLEEQGFPVSRHPARPTFPADSRFDAPVLYAGWYSGTVTGPFTLPGFKFAPGAIAAHLHSFSAMPLHSLEKGWVGPLVEMGACATFGNVGEPYLPYTHHFDMYFKALADGWNVADAAYAALPALSWQAVSIGDPFYVPFGISLDQQVDSLNDPDGSDLGEYVLIRQINQLEQAGQVAEALDLSSRAMPEHPGPALAMKRAQLLEQHGNTRDAREILSRYAAVLPTDANHWGLFATIADEQLRLGDAPTALHIYQNLEKVNMPEQVRLAFLQRGIQSAREAGDGQTADAWDLLVNPPPPDVPEMTDTNQTTGN